jgi:small subunit ribosomal protein S16
MGQYLASQKEKIMALKIRLQRFGSKNRPFYHLVVADSRSPRNGRFVERVGYYNPMQEPSLIEFKTDRISHWYKLGARPTDSVASLLRAKKVDITKL